MANFNPNDYETVAERIKRFYNDHPDARIITHNMTTDQDRQVSTWIVKAEIWLPMFEIWDDAPAQKTPDQSWFLKSTGWAFEVDGGKGANQTSALENAETSAIGRALANANYGGDKRASREEMQKAQRGVTPQAVPALKQDALTALAKDVAEAKSRDQLMAIWTNYTPHLDQTWENSLGVEVSLRSLIMAAAEDLKSA